MTSVHDYQLPVSSTLEGDHQLFQTISTESCPPEPYSAYQNQHTVFGQYESRQPVSPGHFQLNLDSTQQFYLRANHVHSPLYSPAHSISNPFDLQPPILSSTSDSGASVQSNLSSAMGSPSMSVHQSSDWAQLQGMIPDIVHQDHFQSDMLHGFEFQPNITSEKFPGFVDPSLIQPTSPPTYNMQQQLNQFAPQTNQSLLFAHLPSPAPSSNSIQSVGPQSQGVVRTVRATSPYQWGPYQPQRRPSVTSIQSQHSHQSHQSRQSQSSQESSEEGKGICPIPSCGRLIKDLKAHLLTHKNERPEKCPISSCEYHVKGFARKYDKNRHTLTHYKGTMVCGFCPGSGSSAEKSFNRADVFKRHLTSVHGVEQTAPNSRRKSPGSNGQKGGFASRESSGTCSTCGVIFSNAQDFYEHLDDCVLRVVQQVDPSEFINEKLLTSIAHDKAVKETMEKHMLSTSLDFSGPTDFAGDEDEEEEENGFKGVKSEPNEAHRQLNSRQGMTHSKGGVSLNGAGKGNRRRKNYPVSWGSAPEKMKMKKRVLCVFDGPRRLWKDDMMLDGDNEVRVKLPGGDGRRWVTDLDIQSIRRAEGFHQATEEEKGPWMNEDGSPIDLSHFMG